MRTSSDHLMGATSVLLWSVHLVVQVSITMGFGLFVDVGLWLVFWWFVWFISLDFILKVVCKYFFCWIHLAVIVSLAFVGIRCHFVRPTIYSAKSCFNNIAFQAFLWFCGSVSPVLDGHCGGSSSFPALSWRVLFLCDDHFPLPLEIRVGDC